MSVRLLPSLLVVAALLGAAATASAQPQIPSTFFGSVTIDGKAAPEGTEVRGLIDGLDCSQSAPGERPVAREGDATVYVLHVVHESQRPGCGREGKTVTFTVAGRPALQQGTWKFGPQQIDLSAGEGQVIPLPTFTSTVPGSGPATPLPGVTGTASAPTRPTGAPPTDDVQPPGTLTPSGGSPDAGATTPPGAGGGDGSPVWGVLVVAVGLIAAGGAAAGIGLARRRKPPQT